MIKALVNSSWELFDIDELQPGTSVFDFETGLYETMRTRDHRPILLTPHLDRDLNEVLEEWAYGPLSSWSHIVRFQNQRHSSPAEVHQYQTIPRSYLLML